MLLPWFALFLCIFSAFGNELQTGGKSEHLETHDQKSVHPSLRIINGKKTTVKKYPFIASIQNLQGEFGAAAIVGSTWLVTTAFNVAWEALDNLQFRVGSNSYKSDGQVLNALQVFVHPNYTGSWDYDIAVVKTDNINMSNKVKAIKLGSEDLKDGDKANVAGWGMSSTSDQFTPSKVLLEADVTVYDWEKCASVYNSSLTSRLMCTLDDSDSARPCVYDFGDPLVFKKALYGLYAGGLDCEQGGKPALYTDIPSLVDWVNSIINPDKEDKLEKKN